MLPADSTRLDALQGEVESLRARLAAAAGLHELHYRLADLALLFRTSERFWADRIAAGDLGPVQQPGGPVNLSPGSPRGDWRIPGGAVWRYLQSQPLPAIHEPVRARTTGELRRRAA